MKPIISKIALLGIAPVLFLALATLPLPAQRQDAKSSAAAGQQPSAGTFTSRAELVLVPAIVSDHSGAHVSGLTKDDFTVLENGAAQKIATFEEVKPSDAPLHRAVPANGIYSNIAPDNEQPRRISILVLDFINTSFSDQAYARQQLVKYLSQSVNRGELITLLTLTRGGVHVIHDFTTDTAVLLAALKKVRGSIGVMEGENMENLYGDDIGTDANARMAAIEAGDIQGLMNSMEAQATRFQQGVSIQATLDAFRGIAQAYAGVPGRKSLIWVTGSFPFAIEKPGEIRPGPRESDIEHIFDLLNDANISMYPVDARGLVVAMPSAADRVTYNPRNPGGTTQARLSAHTDSLATLQNFAQMTGGHAFYNTNDIAGAVRRASDDSASYYVLGYYRNTADNKAGWRKLNVKVQRGGLNVRARDGFFVGAARPTSAEISKSEVIAALRSPFNFTALPLSVRLMTDVKDAKGPPATAPAGKHAISFQVHVPGAAADIDTDDQNHMSFEFVSVAHDSTLSTADGTSDHVEAHLQPDSLTRIRSAGLVYKNTLQLDAGEYSLRFVVRDNLSGRMGSLTVPATVK